MPEDEYARWAAERGVESLPRRGEGMHTEYMQALFALDKAVKRELDRAQLGQPPATEFAQAVGNVMEQRRRLLYGP